jgi:putative endonuclease
VKDHTYFVYILASKSRVLYIGISNSVQRRTTEHRDELEGFCRRYRVWRLVHYERFHYVLNAIHREKAVKGWSRVKKIALIEATNPTWEDLSQQFGSPAQLGHIPPQHFGGGNEQQIPRRCAPLDDKGDESGYNDHDE